MVLALSFCPSLLCGHEVDVRWLPPSAWPPTLRDIAGRLPANTDARDDDLITYAHEGTHFLCQGGDGKHGIYILHGLRHWIPTPPIATEQVLSAVPLDERGAVYGTYLAQGRTDYWSNRPLMILDEWCAYTHGSMARRELALDSRRETDVYCRTFAGYAAVLWRLAKECEGYDTVELQRFCRWNLARCKEAIPDLDWDLSFE